MTGHQESPTNVADAAPDKGGSACLPDAASDLSPIPDDVYCLRCGYNARGLTGTNCPECGESLELLRSETSAIPWTRRREIGRFSAYWRTVWLVMFRPRRLAAEMARPVSFADAQAFRWVTVAHAFLPLALWVIGFALLVRPAPFQIALLDEVVKEPVAAGLATLGLLVFFAAATGMPSYFFHPRDEPVHRQNRAIALSYYTCAPLAWTILPAPYLGAGLPLLVLAWEPRGRMYLSIAMGLLLLEGLAWWIGPYRLLRCILPHHGKRAGALLASLPAAWFVLAALAFLAPLLIVLLLIAVWASFS
ncbi:MAG: hypothetical protein HY763_11135 [Planctomycetes bacterium]|nr:hypothetical protein [Planctomycetota bacterium]